MPVRQLTKRMRCLLCVLYGAAAVLSAVHLALCIYTGNEALSHTPDQYHPGFETAVSAPTAAGATMGAATSADEERNGGMLGKRTGSGSGSAGSGNGGAGSQAGSGDQAGEPSVAAGGAGVSGSGSAKPNLKVWIPQGHRELPQSQKDQDLEATALQYEKERPEDFASNLKDFGTNSAISTPNTRIHSKPVRLTDPGYMRGLTRLYDVNGMYLNDWMAFEEAQLPKAARSSLPRDASPNDYGYLHSYSVAGIPHYLIEPMAWLAKSDKENLWQLQGAISKGNWLVSTWTHKASAEKNAEQTGGPPASPKLAATDAKFQTVLYPEFRLLLALHVQEPWRPADAKDPFTRSIEKPPGGWYSLDEPSPNTPALKKLPTGLSDKDLDQIGKYHAHDIWHSDWSQSCSGNEYIAAGLSYVLFPDTDKATRDAIWLAIEEDAAIARAKAARRETSANKDQGAAKQEKPKDTPIIPPAHVKAWPGHIYESTLATGEVLIGTPALRNVARLLIQHKDLYGERRSICTIRFWAAQTRADDGTTEFVIPMLVTLSPIDGYQPVYYDPMDDFLSRDSGSSRDGGHEESEHDSDGIRSGHSRSGGSGNGGPKAVVTSP